MDSSDAKHTLINEWMNEYLIENGYSVPGNICKSNSERVWIMLMLKTGKSILKYDESRLPFLVKILQELIEKIKEPELRCKIINCILSTKLKISLNAYPEMCKAGNLTKRERVCIIDKLLSLDEQFLANLSTRETEEVTAHIEELTDFILLKCDIIGQIHAERGAKQACIDELEEVVEGVLKICGQGFLEKVADAITGSAETANSTTDVSEAKIEKTLLEENGSSCFVTKKRRRKARKSSMKSKAMKVSAITGSSETANSTTDVSEAKIEKTLLEENGSSCFVTKKRRRKARKFSMKRKAMKVRETDQNNLNDSKERDRGLRGEPIAGGEDLNSLEDSPEVQPSVTLDRTRAPLSPQAAETSEMTDVVSDDNARSHESQNNRYKDIRTYSKSDKKYTKRHDVLSGRDVYVNEGKGDQEIEPTEKRDSYFKTMSTALLEFSPVKLKSASPKRDSYFKTRSSALLELSPVKLKSTRPKRDSYFKTRSSAMLGVSPVRLKSTRLQARTQKAACKRIKTSDGVRMQTVGSARIQTADIAIVTNSCETSSQETNSTPESSVPSTDLCPSSSCSSNVSSGLKNQAVGVLEPRQGASTDSSYFASVESSSSKELSVLSLPISIDLAKVNSNSIPVSIDRAKLTLNFASKTLTFLKDSEVAASGKTAPRRNKRTNSHSGAAKETRERSPEVLPMRDAMGARHLTFQEADMPSESSTATSSQECCSDEVGFDLRPAAAWSDLCRAEEQSQKIAQTGSSDEATSSASIMKQSPEAHAVTTSKFYSKMPVSIDSQSKRLAESSKLNRAKRKLVSWTESPRSKALRLLSSDGKKGKVAAKKFGALKGEFEKLKHSGSAQRFVVSTKSWNHKRDKVSRKGKNSSVAGSRKDEAPKKDSPKVDQLGQGSSSLRGQYRYEIDRTDMQGVSRKLDTVDNVRKRISHERGRKDVNNEKNIGGDSQNLPNDKVTENCISPLLFASTPKCSSLSIRSLDSSTNASFVSSENPSSSLTPSEKPKVASRFIHMGSKPDQFSRTVIEIDGDLTDASSGTQTLSSGSSLPSGSLQRSKLDLKFPGKGSCRSKLLEKIDKEMQALGTVLEDIDAKRILKNASLELETIGDLNDASQRGLALLNRSFQVLDKTEQSSGTISIESSSSKTFDSDRSFKEGLFGRKEDVSMKICDEELDSVEKLMGLKSNKEVSRRDRVLIRRGKGVPSSTISMPSTLGEKEACANLTGANQRKCFEIKPRKRLAVSKNIRKVISSSESSPTNEGAASNITDHNNNSIGGLSTCKRVTSSGAYKNNNSQPKQSKNRPVTKNNQQTMGDCLPPFQNNSPEIENNWMIRNINSHVEGNGKKPMQCIIEKAETRYSSSVADDTAENARNLRSNNRVNGPLGDVGSMGFDSSMSLIDESHSSQEKKIISRIDKQKVVIEVSDTDSDSLYGVENGDDEKRFSKFSNERLTEYPDCICLSSLSDLSLKLSESLE